MHCLFLFFSPPELCGYRRREKPFLPVSRPLGSEQPASPPVPSHPLEEDGELTECNARQRFTKMY